MEDIVKQIADIDSIAEEKRKSVEDNIKDSKEKYEKQMATYKKEHIEAANAEAKRIIDDLVSQGEAIAAAEEAKSQSIIKKVKDAYVKIEDGLLDEIFNELFEVEG